MSGTKYALSLKSALVLPVLIESTMNPTDGQSAHTARSIKEGNAGKTRCSVFICVWRTRWSQRREERARIKYDRLMRRLQQKKSRTPVIGRDTSSEKVPVRMTVDKRLAPTINFKDAVVLLGHHLGCTLILDVETTRVYVQTRAATPDNDGFSEVKMSGRWGTLPLESISYIGPFMFIIVDCSGHPRPSTTSLL